MNSKSPDPAPHSAGYTFPAFRLDAGNAEAVVFPLFKVVFNLIPQLGDTARRSIAVNLRQIFGLSVDIGSLQSLPSGFHGVISQVARHQMGMQLRIELPAGVMFIAGDDHVRSVPVFIRPPLRIRAPARRSISAAISSTAAPMHVNQPRIFQRHHRKAFGAETVKS